MAPAAADTIKTYFTDTGTKPADFDMIITGDLAEVGAELMNELLMDYGFDIKDRHYDCGLMIFDRTKQEDVKAGGSGCGCSGSVMCSYILNELKMGTIKRVLFCGTGALMSSTSSQQGQSIPSIAHLVEISV